VSPVLRGVKFPEELIAEYEALGYDFLAITDHDDLITDDYWRALRALSPTVRPDVRQQLHAGARSRRPRRLDRRAAAAPAGPSPT
jgi:cytosine/adenosine deaminase-related metal-dependent hydrolase